MKRNYNIKRTSFVCVALLSAALPGVAKKKQVRPNVVFIYADDFRIRAREYVNAGGASQDDKNRMYQN